MKHTYLAISLIGVAITLAAEIPACHRIIFRVVPHHHSKATLAKWAEWNKTHVPPSPKEILAELDLACPPVDLEEIDTGDFIPAEVVPAWEPVEFEPDVTLVALEVPETDYPSFGYALTPPFAPYALTPVPEPWTFGMVAVGMAAMFVKLKLEVPSE
jgi:hypothetical protein